MSSEMSTYAFFSRQACHSLTQLIVHYGLKQFAQQDAIFLEEYLPLLLPQIFKCYFEVFPILRLKQNNRFRRSIGDPKIRLDQKDLKIV